MNYDDLYQELDEKLRQLLDDLSDVFSLEDRRDVLHFVEHNEFGLALGTITGIIVEEDKYISPSLIMKIKALAEQMEMKDEVPYDLNNYAHGYGDDK